MDPLTAFSLFCNIITTVEAVIKTGRELKELYESPSGLASDKQRLQHETAQLRQIATGLNTTRRNLASDPRQPLLVDIAQECADVTRKIDAILDECQAGGHGSRYITVVKAWVRSRKKKPELDRLLSELESTTQRLQTAIVAASQADLDALKDQVYKHGVQQSEMAERLASIKDDLLSQRDLLANMQRLTTAFEEAQESIRHAAILRALKPSAADAREDEIQVHHPKTFDWILNRHGVREVPWSHAAEADIWPTSIQKRWSDIGFLNWLTDGSGVYHIAGKPGSGKSTLMKFLANEPAVRTHLELWAASMGKQLILSKFFFWKYGSDDQKSVRGLLRGLLYDMAKDNISITKTLFPRLWGDAKGWRLPSASDLIIKGSDIRAAFNQLRTDKGLRQQFRLCLFIDGLDEFDGKEMSHSRLAKELQAWTEDADSTSFLKVCVSSREEHPIMSAFLACQRIHLQDLTRSDISAIVKGTLEASEFFLQLQQEDRAGSRALVTSIVTDAEGVFLWVVLLLKLLEDELSSAISSIAALRSIVRSTPKELEEFLGHIMDSIHNHHKHGAYFILSMVLRMMGIHLSEEGSFDEADRATHEAIFKRTYGITSSWQPHLPLYGVAKVLDEFDKNNTAVESWPSPKWVTDYEYRVESQKAAGKIKSWCKGLLDVPDTLSLSTAPLHDLTLRFAHRSIPDFLASAIPMQARKFTFGDDDIARAILALTITQTVSAPGLHKYGHVDLAMSFHHILLLLRLRQIPESSQIPRMLEELDVARFEAYQRFGETWHRKFMFSNDPDKSRFAPVIRRGDQQGVILPLKWAANVIMNRQVLSSASPVEGNDMDDQRGVVFIGTSAVLLHACHAGLDEYVRWKLEKEPGFKEDKAQLYVGLYGLLSYFWFHGRWSRAHTSLLRRLLGAGTPFNLRFPRPPPSKNATEDSSLVVGYPASYIRDSLRRSAATQEPKTNRDIWLWPVMLSKLLESLVLSTPALVQLWEKLEVWLEFGAMPPLEILLERFDEEYGEAREKQLTKLFRQVNTSDGESIRSDFAESAEEKADSIGYIFFRLPVAQDRLSGSPVEVWYLRTAFAVRKDNICKLIPHLQTSRSITFTELVRYHNPPNVKGLLEYIDRSQALLEAGLQAGGKHST
ncbi:hypothetical protein B0T10DRAFT_569027 [Thelonectria olida]|uniref:Nephrocystin 3-like N-terminal domain-containing protein n=1 Tax=Thelonectria olida TaxID=1576542 RepID=A0A9P8VPN8_9HYPO|nr:hypothetical protein B0T10DRAFT_569027 [Thelonectria olida]